MSELEIQPESETVDRSFVSRVVYLLRDLWFVCLGLVCMFAGHTWNQLGESSQTNITQFAAWTVGILGLLIATIILLWLFFSTWELIAFCYRPSRFQLRLLAGVRRGYVGTWYVTFAGERIAKLSDPKREEMFWTRYRLTPLLNDPSNLTRCQDQEFWDFEWEKLEYENLVTGEVRGGNVTPGVLEIDENGELSISVRRLNPQWRLKLRWYETLLLNRRARRCRSTMNA